MSAASHVEQAADPLAWLPLGDVVAVLRAPSASLLEPVITTLVENGVTNIELTLTTPGVLEHVGHLRGAAGPEARVGVGTVLERASALAAIEAGAQYLVTPSVVPGVLEAAQEQGIPVLGGAMTPSEAWAQYSAGAGAVKIFPAQTVGPAFVKHLHGPFPGMPIVPSGGVALDSIEPWLRAGARAVSLGGPLVGDACMPGADLGALARRAHEARRVVEQWLEAQA